LGRSVPTKPVTLEVACIVIIAIHQPCVLFPISNSCQAKNFEEQIPSSFLSIRQVDIIWDVGDNHHILRILNMRGYGYHGTDEKRRQE
jgi:hypothetical protein